MSLLERILLVALGGAVGSVARFLAAVQFGASPMTTFCVNITGSFLIGLVVALTPTSDQRLRLLLATGFLGGYTTFSAWQLEALFAAQTEAWRTAVLILFGSLIAGFIAVAAGWYLGSRFIPSA